MQPILAIDVSKASSHAAIYLELNKPIMKPFIFTHDVKGLKTVFDLLDEISHNIGVKPIVVMEATGNYSKLLCHQFIKQGYLVHVFNPLMTHEAKKSSIRKIKTDPIDVARIAYVFYTRETIPYTQNTQIIDELKIISRQYNGLNQIMTDHLRRLSSLLDLFFPEIKKVFYSVNSKGCLQFLSKYPTIASLENASVDDVISALYVPKQKSSWRYDKANLILKLVKESIADSYLSEPINTLITTLVGTLTYFMSALDNLRNQMIQLCKSSPSYNLLLSIPGIGEITAAFILADIGAIDRFSSKKALVAYAGLDPSIYQSGQFLATGRISKRGSPYLRTAIYQSTTAAISMRKNGCVNLNLRTYYELKTSQGKPKKVALIATANKMTRIIYGVLSSGEEYKPM